MIEGITAAAAPAIEYTIGHGIVIEPDVTVIAVPPICAGSG